MRMVGTVDYPLIGLEGGAGSGKDLVADWFASRHGYTKIAFADPLKRFAHKAFGFTADALWGSSGNRNQMYDVDEAWWFNASGLIPQATDELMNGGVVKPGYRATGYLKLLEWFTNTRKNWPHTISPRLILQTLGTEWGRAVDPGMWVDYAYDCISDLARNEISYTQVGGTVRAPHPPPSNGVCIPDHRFLNEIELTQAKGGMVIRLRRPALEEKTVGVEGHRSETERKTIPDSAFDLVLEIGEFPVTGCIATGRTGPNTISPPTTKLVGFDEALNKVMEKNPWVLGKGAILNVDPS